MINDDVLVLYSLQRLKEGFTPDPRIKNWVDYTKLLTSQIREIRDWDFTAIGLGDLNLIRNTQVTQGMRIILSDFLDNNCGNLETDNATILGLVSRVNPDNPMVVELDIEGIGRRPDFTRDPDRLLQWGQKIYPDLTQYPCILQLTSKPRCEGGSVYYYYNKDARDARISWVEGKPVESSRACLGILWNMATSNLDFLRERAQYMHFYRRNFQEVCGILEDIHKTGEGMEYEGVLSEIYNLYLNSPKPTKITCKELSKNVLEILRKYGYTKGN